ICARVAMPAFRRRVVAPAASKPAPMMATDIRAATVPQKSVGPGRSLPSSGPYAVDGTPGSVARLSSVVGSWRVGGQAQPRPKNRTDSAPPPSTVRAARATPPNNARAVASPGLSRASSVGVSCAAAMAMPPASLSVVGGGPADGDDQAGPGRDWSDLNGFPGLWRVDEVAHS